MQNLDWWAAYLGLQQLVGYKVKVDGEYAGTIRMALGGPVELFFMIEDDSKIIYIDAMKDPARIDIIE